MTKNEIILQKKPFAKFYAFLSKEDRVKFYSEAWPLLEKHMCRSTFYYKVKYGNLLPHEALLIKDILKKYGATKEVLLSLGIVEGRS